MSVGWSPIIALLEILVCKMLGEDLTQFVERKMTLLITKSSLMGDVIQQCGRMAQHDPGHTGHKGILLRPIISTIGAVTYSPTEHVARLLGSQLCSPVHSEDFIHT
jgi:hypothetical protein